MSVLRGDRPAGEFPFSGFKGPSHPCFMCGKDVGPDLVIHWMGTGGDIFFHPDCVPSFCRRVLEDWERVKGFKPLGDVEHKIE